ncbi:hypothetical protein P4U43_17865 [Arthrobacter sp. EH-1B-1]|uniref:Uncharacterized protein n=2 Tax=Arthrobacter TaxID=1663 RepID=A0ABT6D031_9MICC|nr:hypothetical protein [Arthrobacter vasquezii]MDF9279652.1 hypothetical protein [Arthrobacter vasquezii]
MTFGIASIVVALLAGCSSSPDGDSGMSASREKLYESVTELVSDSSTVVVGEVIAQETDSEKNTVSTVAINSIETPPALGEAIGLPELPILGSGDSVGVRQLGTPDMSETPAPILEVGQSYLLFLRPTELPGEASELFYVVGGVAGIFVADAGTFSRLVRDSGDQLPNQLTTADLAG